MYVPALNQYYNTQANIDTCRNGRFQRNPKFHFILVNGSMLDVLHYHSYFWHGKFVKQEMLWRHETFPWQ